MSTPYITPEKFHKGKVIDEINTAIICYCPFPEYLEEFVISVSTERYFIHSSPSEVRFCETKPKNRTKFLVISEVYGGPVSATTVEELHYYGIKNVIGIGFAGGLEKDNKLGDIFLANKCFADDGTTCKYTDKEFINCHYDVDIIKKQFKKLYCDIKIKNVWCGSALYNETVEETNKAIDKGCQVVNMDTSHLYAITNIKDMNALYFGIITDVHKDDGEWKNGLFDIVCETKKSDNNIVLKRQTMLLSVVVNYVVTGDMIVDEVTNFLTTNMKDRDETHGVSHCLAVARNTKYLVDDNSIRTDAMVVALLHDVYDHKYEDSDKRKALVEQLVKDLKLNPETIMAIDSISFSKEKKLGMHWYQNKLSKRMLRVRNIVSDADKLEALGEEGYNRCVAFIKEKNKDISDAKVRELLLEHCKEKLFVMEPYFRTKNGIETCRMLTKELKDRVLEDVV